MQFLQSHRGSVVELAHLVRVVLALLGSKLCSGKKREIFDTLSLTRVQFPRAALKFVFGFLCAYVIVKQYLKSPVILYERQLCVYCIHYIFILLIIRKGI